MHERVIVVGLFIGWSDFLGTADLEGRCITTVETDTNVKKM